MTNPMQGSGESSNERPASATPIAEQGGNSGAPERARTTAKTSDIPKARPFALMAWLTVPVLIALLLLAGLFMLPGLKSNSEDKDPIRRSNDSEQSRPE